MRQAILAPGRMILTGMHVMFDRAGHLTHYRAGEGQPIGWAAENLVGPLLKIEDSGAVRNVRDVSPTDNSDGHQTATP